MILPWRKKRRYICSRIKLKKKSHEKARLAVRKRKSEEEIALLFRKESWGTGEEAGADNGIPPVEDDFDDEDSWEDEEEVVEKENYNTLSLKYFAREVDRYGWSDRGAAKIGNGLLKDLGLVRKGKTKMLICSAKVRRERQQWGRQAATEHDKHLYKSFATAIGQFEYDWEPFTLTTDDGYYLTMFRL